MLVAPDAVGEQPPTDGGFYHAEGVPIVNFGLLFYLFDAMDTLDKVDRANPVPLTPRDDPDRRVDPRRLGRRDAGGRRPAAAAA